jgi:hypothetical protein
MVSDSLAMRSIVTIFVAVEIHGVFGYPDCLAMEPPDGGTVVTFPIIAVS